MNKLRPEKQNTQHFPLALVRVLSCSLAFAAALLSASCEYFTYKRPFTDPYYDANFIGHIGFDRLLAAADLPPADPATGVRSPVFGRWDFAYRYQNWDGFEYLSLEPVSDAGFETAGGAGFASVPDGLQPSAPVYRLELLNLASGGDFEAPADNPAVSGLWSVGGTVVPPSTFALVTIGAINGRSAALAVVENSPVSYLISPPAGLFTQGSLYSVDFRWKSADGFPSGTSNLIRMNEQLEPFSANPQSFHASSQFLASGSGADRIKFEVPIGWNGSIDDVTVKKVGGMELRLLLRQADTEPELKDLLYRFSVWVHADPSVGASSSPYRLEQLEAQMQATPVSIVSTKPRSRYDVAAGGWQIVEVEVESGNLMFPDESPEPVLELVIDLDRSLPGRVLLAQPELRAYPDGYPD